MNATDILAAQHRAIEGLFQELASENRPRARARAAARLTEELIAHMAAEENIFYPVARPFLAGVRGPGDIGGHAPDEHFMLRAQLRRVLATSVAAPAFTPRFEALRLLFAHHVDCEETVIFPRIDAALGARGLETLGAEITGGRPPIWAVVTETGMVAISRNTESVRGVRLPSLRDN